MTIEELLENEELIKIMVKENEDKSSMRYGHKYKDTDNSEYINSIKKLFEVDLPFPNPINRKQRRANIAQERK